MTNNTLHNTIMRRVYYAYAIRLTLHPVMIHSAVFAACIAMLTHFVSFPNVIANLLEVKLGEVHTYLFRSALSTEIWTLLLFTVATLVLVSLYVQMSASRTKRAGQLAYSG